MTTPPASWPSHPAHPAHAVGRALATAIDTLRTQLGDPFAAITVVVPAGPNTVFARTALALQGPFMRVWFDTPEGIAADHVPPSTWGERRPEPAGWRRPFLRRVLRRRAAAEPGNVELLRLQRSGWLEPLLGSIARLEERSLGADDLRRTGDPSTLLLASLIDALDAERVRRGYLTDSDIARAATAACDTPEVAVAAAAARGVVVLGDRELPRAVHEFMRTWLARRAVVHLALPVPLRAAGGGIRAALATTIDDGSAVDVAAVDIDAVPGKLRQVLSQLFHPATTVPTSADDDHSVELARTPDDVREAIECVREVQRGIAAGIALDRIAIVLPDSLRRAALDDALTRARLPTTWLIGAPASTLMPARLLTLALEVAAGRTTVERLYELLMHPALSLRSALGPAAVVGRGRWRRFLSHVRHARGIDRVLSALRDTAPAAIADAALDDDSTAAAREAAAADLAARTALITSLEALLTALAPLSTSAPLSTHAARWVAFLERFGRVGAERGKILQLIAPLTRGADTNAVDDNNAIHVDAIDVDEARDEWQRLAARELARGSLTERSLRVVSPLHLVGGSFDLVCLLGANNRRFPGAAHEDPFVGDRVLRAIDPGHDGTVAAHEVRERRRFAAVVGAARQRLWISVPGLDFDSERPTLPSPFVLDVASALLGRRASFADLDALFVRRGRRAHAWPLSADDAIDDAEHLLTRSALTPTTTLPALAANPFTRGALHLHRSIDTTRVTTTLMPHTGLAGEARPPIPGLDGATVSVAWVAQLMSAMTSGVFGRVLGARTPSWLGGIDDLLTTKHLHLQLLRAALTTTTSEQSPSLAAPIAAAVTAQLADLVKQGALDAADVELVAGAIDEEAGVIAASLQGWSRSPVEVARPGMPVDVDLPWRIDSLVGRRELIGEELVLVDVVTDRRGFSASHVPLCCPALVLSALALQLDGVPLDGIAVRSVGGGKPKVFAFDHPDMQAAIAGLHTMTAMLRAGHWPTAAWKERFSNEVIGSDDDDDGDGSNLGGEA